MTKEEIKRSTAKEIAKLYSYLAFLRRVEQESWEFVSSPYIEEFRKSLQGEIERAEKKIEELKEVRK